MNKLNLRFLGRTLLLLFTLSLIFLFSVPTTNAAEEENYNLEVDTIIEIEISESDEIINSDNEGEVLGVGTMSEQEMLKTQKEILDLIEQVVELYAILIDTQQNQAQDASEGEVLGEFDEMEDQMESESSEEETETEESTEEDVLAESEEEEGENEGSRTFTWIVLAILAFLILYFLFKKKR